MSYDAKVSAHDAKVIDAVSEDDREWFAANPGERVRWRVLVPGEFPDCQRPGFSTVLPAPPECLWLTEVFQMEPGFRIRTPRLLGPVDRIAQFERQNAGRSSGLPLMPPELAAEIERRRAA